MATLFVSNGGSNTSPYDTWAKAATSFQTALTAATAGDTVVIQYDSVPSGDAALSVDTTYTFPNGIWVVSASNDGGSAYTLTAMGTSNFIGHSSSNRSITFDTSTTNKAKVYIYGITWRISGATTDNFRIGNASNGAGAFEFENCYFWQGNTSTSSCILFSYPNCHVTLVGCTIRAGATAQAISAGNILEMIGCTLSSAGSAPTNLIGGSSGGGAAVIRATGCDFSYATSNLVADSVTTGAVTIILERCKLGSGVSPMAAQTTVQGKNTELWLLDCHVGDTHMQFGYYNGLGSLTLDTGIYFTSGAAAASWKIVTSSYCNSRTPFKTPWIDKYHSAASAITPYFEILRDGSATAYKDGSVWGEFSGKTTSGFTTATSYIDRAALATFVSGGAGSDQAAGAGLGSWTGEGGTAWSGKVDSGSSFTPAEIGYLRGRLCFGVASDTIYLDPEIRT